tara:strand:- start:73298 stop:74893 length:1596 start_codon:yes stop_codon:yes gene_type:complete
LRLIHSIKTIIVLAFTGSLLAGIYRGLPIDSAERVELHIEEMSIPISIKELDDWSSKQNKQNSELSDWLSLLGFEDREALAKLIKEPLPFDQNIALELLQSWFGRKIFEEISNSVRIDNEGSGEEIYKSLEYFLKNSNKGSILDFITSLPANVIHIDLDEMVKVAKIWRRDIKRQQQLIVDIDEIVINKTNLIKDKKIILKTEEPTYNLLKFDVSHRDQPLEIEIWTPSKKLKSRKSWILFMPGFGGDKDHFRWLAKSLSSNGWPVVILEHAGSDSMAVKAFMEGVESAPGLEVIPDRMKDLRSVLKARDNGLFKVQGEDLILMGHSLGSFTSLLATGAQPQEFFKQICSKELSDLSLTNLSKLLQCQLLDISLDKQEEYTPKISAVVGINSFGSLLWPKNLNPKIDLPVFLIGGTFDLVTPAIYEQIGLLLATKKNKFSRVLLVEGASHFSPIRVKGKMHKNSGEDIFKLNKSIVGANPLSVQSILSEQIIRFLYKFENNESIPIQINSMKEDLKFHIIDHKLSKELSRD